MSATSIMISHHIIISFITSIIIEMILFAIIEMIEIVVMIALLII